MFLLSLENGELINPNKIECVRMFGDKKHLKMASGEVFEITENDLEHIERVLGADFETSDANREILERMANSLEYIENFLHRYANKYKI